MKRFKRTALLAALTLTSVLAQSTGTSSRIMKVEGAPRGDLRNGPLTYTGNPVKGQVSTLKVEAGQATVSAPAGVAMADAEGKRTGTFTGNVVITRNTTSGNLTAKGNSLIYQETTGQGALSGNASAVFTSKEKGDEVKITATAMSLDVDQSVSTSTGNVMLTSGPQVGKANKLVFDEDREIAKLTGNPSLTRASSGNVKELVITASEVRALTSTKTLYIRGKVKLVQGNLITTGDAVCYDDQKNTAYIVGNAVSVNNGVKQVAPKNGYIEQRTDRGSVRVLSSKYTIPAAQFKLRGE